MAIITNYNEVTLENFTIPALFNNAYGTITASDINQIYRTTTAPVGADSPIASTLDENNQPSGRTIYTGEDNKDILIVVTNGSWVIARRNSQGVLIELYKDFNFTQYGTIRPLIEIDKVRWQPSPFNTGIEVIPNARAIWSTVEIPDEAGRFDEAYRDRFNYAIPFNSVMRDTTGNSVGIIRRNALIS